MGSPPARSGASHIVSSHSCVFSCSPALLCFPLCWLHSQARLSFHCVGKVVITNSRLNSTSLKERECLLPRNFWKIRNDVDWPDGAGAIPESVACELRFTSSRQDHRPSPKLREWVGISGNKTVSNHSLVPRRLYDMLLAKGEGKDVGQVNTTGCKNLR